MWREPGDCALEPRERYGGAKSLTTSVKRAAGLRVAPGADDAEVSCLVSKSFGQSDREPELPRHGARESRPIFFRQVLKLRAEKQRPDHATVCGHRDNHR